MTPPLQKLDLNGSYDNDFAAAAVLINDKGIATHGGIYIYENNTHYLLHYTSVTVELDENDDRGQWYIFKNFEFIIPTEIPSFLSYCKKIKNRAKPLYGFCYTGSYYDSNGDYQATNELPQLMTCVGFCLNVLNGFIEEEQYINYTDWTLDNKPYSSHLQQYINQAKQHISEELLETYNNSLRRIDPTDFICCAYCSNIPVTKNEVDKIKSDVSISLKAFIPEAA